MEKTLSKIAYCVKYNLKPFPDGIMIKIKDQVNAWKEFGVEVQLFVISKTFYNNDYERDLKVYPWGFWSRDNGPRRLLGDLELFKPDIIYTRQDFFRPYWHTIYNKYKVCVEINSDDLNEYMVSETISRKLRYYHTFTRSILLQKATGLIFVTREISEKKHFKKFNKPYAVVPNSINTTDVTVRKENYKESLTNCIFIGTPRMTWHGIDKLVELAKQLGQDFRFHFIGIDSFENAPANCIFHGFIDKQSYSEILKSCHIAFGTFALHRKKMDEACPLKVREYLASGLPTVIAYKDTAFEEKTPEWILQIPNEEDVLNKKDILKTIKDFCYSMKYIVLQKNQIDQFVNTTVIERKRFDFFKHCSKI